MDFFRCTTENVVIVKAVHGELLFGESSTVFYLVLGSIRRRLGGRKSHQSSSGSENCRATSWNGCFAFFEILTR
jgi:hypothetical protein